MYLIIRQLKQVHVLGAICLISLYRSLGIGASACSELRRRFLPETYLCIPQVVHVLDIGTVCGIAIHSNLWTTQSPRNRPYCAFCLYPITHPPCDRSSLLALCLKQAKRGIPEATVRTETAAGPHESL